MSSPAAASMRPAWLDAPVIKEGVLEKKLKIQGYQDRFFVLRSKTLVYYKTETDAHTAPEKPLGVIPLKVRRMDGCIEVTQLSDGRMDGLSDGRMTHMRSGGVHGHAREWRPDGTCVTRGRHRERQRDTETERENVCMCVCLEKNSNKKKVNRCDWASPGDTCGCVICFSAAADTNGESVCVFVCVSMDVG